MQSVDASLAEVQFRRRWYQAHCNRFAAETALVEADEVSQAGFTSSAAEALTLRDTLARSGDADAFLAGLQDWARKPGTLAFNGVNGQMMMNQLVQRSDDKSALARVLTATLPAPRDDAEAAGMIQALVDYVETIRVGAHPATGRVTFILSYFWALEDHDRWPLLWPSAAAFLEFCIGEPLPTDPAERYQRYLDLVREVEDDYPRFEAAAAWWDRARPVFLDSVLVDRCAFGIDPEAVAPEALAANAAVLVSVAGYLGSALVDDMSAAAGMTLVAKKPSKLWRQDRPRSDLWTDWWTKDVSSLGLRVWVNHNGVSIGLRPGWIRDGWYEETAAILGAAGLPGFRLIGVKTGRGEDVGHIGGSAGESTYARWYEPGELGELDLRAECKAVAAAVQPLLDQLVQMATGEAPPDDTDPLGVLVEEFRARGYPTPADDEHHADRERFAAVLAADAIALADPAELRRIWNTRRYGGPGPMSGLNTSIKDADAAEYGSSTRSRTSAGATARMMPASTRSSPTPAAR